MCETIALANAFDRTDCNAGNAKAVKRSADVAVLSPTFTEIGPLVAPMGTDTLKLVELAENTVAVTPLNLTVFAVAVLLKPCPCIVTVENGPPCTGVKLNTLNAP